MNSQSTPESTKEKISRILIKVVHHKLLITEAGDQLEALIRKENHKCKVCSVPVNDVCYKHFDTIPVKKGS